MVNSMFTALRDGMEILSVPFAHLNFSYALCSREMDRLDAIEKEVHEQDIGFSFCADAVHCCHRQKKKSWSANSKNADSRI